MQVDDEAVASVVWELFETLSTIVIDLRLL